MKQFTIKSILLLSLLMILSCGFKVVDNKIGKNFTIKEIKTKENNRINYKIKNNLLMDSQKDSSNFININLTTSKIKNIKEKNIKNEVTKYEISLKVIAKIISIDNSNEIIINTFVNGEYLVADNYSNTLNNEKNLIENLAEILSQRILKQISLRINDL